MKKIALLLIAPSVFFLNSCNNSSTTQVEEILTEETVYTEYPSVEIEPGAYTVPSLQYAYNALEPYFDARTMEIHHSKHHAAYTNNFNKAIAGTELEKLDLLDLLNTLDMNNAALRNNAGGHYNHGLFWETMTPNGGGTPEGGVFSEDLNATFGSFEAFKEQFIKASTSRFGSGWAWLYVDNFGKLAIGSTANQDNPLMPGLDVSGYPLLGLDVWEHAYYLNYQNKRADYAEAFFNVVNWSYVATKYEKVKEALIKLPA